MAENSKIEWTDGPKRKTRFNHLTTEKVAAKKTGCDLETWRLNRQMGLRWCYRCKQWKPISNFNVDRSRATQSASLCHQCNSLASRASKYRISFTRAKELLSKGCSICGRHARAMTIDHCHKTGKVRDGLCNRCNVALGLFRDDPELITKALKYLEVHSGREN